ncbi:hypothetical protein HXA34_20520 [Salipaludibacillus agaradhaerens]|uniref:hypothetical protein n=1 Tax=Salipaludibacillus agaradhaerens TaxID=76935 RepID=UPI002150A4E1|nr:hypothetical protein [Salipaludibacillus agaradhaerens]MCR6108684.1 hypothetical protein [Salipaludibacillus agaradhaerens]MCR6120707.1 hypothetical protein [Salipaludibacillus agaradhaerens]
MITTDSVKQTNETSSIITTLREKKLRLHAYRSKGRYICRIVDESGSVVSLSSRSTLVSAVSIAIDNIRSSKEVRV